MPFVSKSLALFLLSIAAVRAADKAKATFETPPIERFAARQTNAGITLAAQPYDTEARMKSAFGKLNLARYELLPVLVSIRNESRESLRLEGMHLEYIGPDRRKREATPPRDIAYLGGAKRPTINTGGPVPGLPGRIAKGKNPLSAWEIEGRAFSARMLAPGESASGFVYFQTQHHSGSLLYVTGIREARSGKDVFYFEVPLPDRGAP